jgi:hypothetical protein
MACQACFPQFRLSSKQSAVGNFASPQPRTSVSTRIFERNGYLSFKKQRSLMRITDRQISPFSQDVWVMDLWQEVPELL